MISEIKAWRTSDGKIFDVFQYAEHHEEFLKSRFVTRIKYPELSADEAFSRKLSSENKKMSIAWKESGLCYHCGHDQFEDWTITHCKKCDTEQP